MKIRPSTAGIKDSIGQSSTLSRYCGRYLAMALAVAGDTSEGLMMTVLPAAMAPVGGKKRFKSCVCVCVHSGGIKHRSV